MKRRKFFVGVVALVLPGISIPSALYAQTAVPGSGQAYPMRPIRMIVAFPPGGATDIMGRIVAAKLSERFGQQVVLDNRGGASGIIGHDIVAKAQPDGYTLLTGSATLTTNNSLYSKVPHTINDFAPVAWVAVNPLVLVAHPSLPIKSVPELIAHAKANPGKLSWGAGSPGTLQHLSGELLKHTAGIDVQYIPYKGTGALLPDLIGGRLNFAFESVPTMAPFIKAGTLRGVAVTGADRSAAVPDVQTVVEAGMPDLVVMNWFGVFAPARTPPPIINRLHREITAAMSEPDTQNRLQGQGAQTRPGTPEELARFVRDETGKWGNMIRRIGLKMD